MPPQPPSPLSLSIRAGKYDDHSTFDMDEDDHSVTLRRPSSRMNSDAPAITTSSPPSPTSPTTPTTPCSANSLSSLSSASSLSLSQVPVVRRASVTDSILFSSFAETRVPAVIQLETEDDTVYVEKLRQRRTINGPMPIPRAHTIAAHRSAPPSPHYRRSSSRPASPLTRSYRDGQGEPAELLDILQNLLDPRAPPPGPPPSAPLPPPPPRRTTSMNFEPSGLVSPSALVPPRKDSLSRLRYVSAI
ncbi:hypothetical protein BJ742DRAFT_306012 [Cladochytrium replicatum]|nr:hypothetical protein BJ742DRAFT_306012 [Cladochytrium replicatum]